MSSKRSNVLALLIALALPLVPVAPAEAMSCQTWTRLDEAGRRASIDRMIESAIAGQGGRSYNVNRSAIRRCLESRSRDMYYDFEDTCADARTAGMQAINRLFKDYIWNCVG